MPTLELGPIGLLPPSAAAQGIFHPKKDSGMDLVEGEHVPTDEAITKVIPVANAAVPTEPIPAVPIAIATAYASAIAIAKAMAIAIAIPFAKAKAIK